MVSKRIETQLTIKAVDQFSSVLRGMQGATGRFADKVRTDLGQLQKLRGPLQLIEDFRKQQSVVRESGEALDRARERVRQLKHEITSTSNPTAQMRREFDRARSAAERLEQKHGQNRATLRGLQAQMQNAGVNTRDLAGEQRRLAGALDQGTTAYGRQLAKMQKVAAMQQRIAAGRERMERTLASAANLSFVGYASMQTGRRIMTGISGPIRQAVEFESAMSDVKKVVDFDSPDAFKKMSEDILELSGRIPMAAEGIAAIVAAGGQSGLQNSELLQFAEMASKVGVAFDISADQSGDAMASIKTALGLTLDETGLVFDAINHLSNNMASTAPKVLEFMTRAGSAGLQAGFSAEETLAVGSAMIAAGAQADVASTSFLNVGRALTKGASATKRQTDAMNFLKLDTIDVAKRMQEDATGTLIDVLTRINQLPEFQRTSIISDIFGDEARALGPLIGNIDLLRESLKLVADQRDYAGSADAEYAARAATTANNLQLMQNKLARLGTTIGEVMLPPLNEMLDTLQPIIDRITVWTKAHPKLTKFLMAGAAATAALAVAGGVLMSAAAGLIGTLAVLRFGLVGFGARAGLAAAQAGLLRGAFGGLLGMRKLRLASLIAPLRWTPSLVPMLTATAFGRLVTGGAKLALSALVAPLKWTSKLLPNFAPALARFTAFRIAATAQMARLSAAAGFHAKLIGGAFASGLAKFLLKGGAIGTGIALGLGIKPTANGELTPEAEEGMRTQTQDDINREAVAIRAEQAATPDKKPGRLERWGVVSGPEPLPPGRASSLPDLSPQLVQIEQQVAALERLKAVVAEGPLPTESRLDRMADRVSEARQEVEELQAALAAMPPAQAQSVPGEGLRLQLAEKRAQLQQMETDLAQANARAVELQTQLQIVSETQVAPEINTASIDAALEKVASLAAQLRAMPPAQASGGKSEKPQERATGGPFGIEPLLVGERGPEMYFPNRAGFIATNRQLMRMQGAAQRVRTAGAAALSASIAATPAAAMASPAAGFAAGARVEINGGIHVTVPSGITDPEAIVDHLERRLGDRLAATISASFSG